MRDNMFKLRNNEKLQYHSNLIITTMIVIIIAITVNILLTPSVLKKIIGMDTLKWDMTQNKQYSIGDITKNVLTGLRKDIEIYILYNDDSSEHSDEKSIMEFLGEYEKYGHVTIQKVNPDENPGIISKIDPDNAYDLHEDNIVIKCGKNIKTYFTQQLYMENSYEANGTNKWDGEQVITGAIKDVISEKRHALYFVTGHGEKKLSNDFKILNSYIEKNNYETKSLNLMEIEKIPNDAEIIIFPSPEKDITTDEKIKIANYFSIGGKAMFLFNYLDNPVHFTNFEDLIKNYNISLDYDEVKESEKNSAPKSNYNLVVTPIINTVTNPIVWNVNKILMPECRSINILKNQNEKINVIPVLKTSKLAVGEQVDKSKESDISGPLNLAVAAEYMGEDGISKIFVSGNCNFLSDSIVSQSPYAVNFFINVAKWMQNNQDEEIIAPKSLEFGTLQIDKEQANMLSISIIVALPVIIFSVGLAVWLRRRNL